MKAILDRVLIQETATKDEGFIWTPERDRMTPKRGVVVSVGVEVRQVEVGHAVMYPEQACVTVPVNGNDLHLIPEHHILGVLDEEE